MKKILLAVGACLFVYSLHAYIDLNNNGLSDVYEFIYFNGPTDPFGDADGDGVSNYDEMVWGTNPTNGNSRITRPIGTLDSGQVSLSWPIAPYRVYTLEASTNMIAWQVVTNGTVSNFSQSIALSNQRFYRLSVTFAPAKAGGDGLDPWEEALYVATFGVSPASRDSDGDGLNDLAEFLQGNQPGKKDHPAVGLVVFTPLEK